MSSSATACSAAGTGANANDAAAECADRLQAAARDVAQSVALTRCQGKDDCVEVCPEQVFELRRIDATDSAALGLLHRFKLRVHGMRVAYALKANACLGCGLCVAACPEHAITLRRRGMQQAHALPRGKMFARGGGRPH